MKRTDRFFGCHVSAAGGLHCALERAEAFGINTMQLHPSPPQRWNAKPYPEGVEKKFLTARQNSAIKKVFFHAIYLINLANPDPQQFHLSKSSLAHNLELMERIEGDGVIFHVGSMKDQSDESVGYRRAAEGVNWAVEHAPGKSLLLLEVAAGSGAIIGDRIEELAEIYSHVDDKSRVGFALDTQHLWASGYELTEDLDAIIAQIDDVLSLKKVKAIHLNDSKTAKGSRKDRHENVGEGLIGNATLERVFNHPKLKDIPFILETPAMKEEASTKREIEKLRAWL